MGWRKKDAHERNMKTSEKERKKREKGVERRGEAVVRGYTGVGLDSLYSLLR